MRPSVVATECCNKRLRQDPAPDAMDTHQRPEKRHRFGTGPTMEGDCLSVWAQPGVASLGADDQQRMDCLKTVRYLERRLRIPQGDYEGLSLEQLQGYLMWLNLLVSIRYLETELRVPQGDYGGLSLEQLRAVLKRLDLLKSVRYNEGKLSISQGDYEWMSLDQLRAVLKRLELLKSVRYNEGKLSIPQGDYEWISLDQLRAVLKRLERHVDVSRGTQ